MTGLRQPRKIDLENWNSSHSLAVLSVPPGSRVLDLGTGDGSMARVLKERGCTIWGIERDERAAEAAAQVCDRVIVADLEAGHALEQLGDETFDVLLALDVLEHLRDPAAVLRRAASSLRSDGIAIVSIPNVTHGARRLSLLEGRFDYTEQGLLDRMQLRFFDRRGAERLMSEAGLTITQHLRVRRELDETEIPIKKDGVPPEVLRNLAHDDDATTYQFVFVAGQSNGLAASSAHLTLPERLLAENDSLLARLRGMETSIRKLETERVQLRSIHDDDTARCLQLQRERDEAREEIGRRIHDAHGIQRDLNSCKASLIVKEAFITDLRQELLAVPTLVSERDALRAAADRLVAERDRLNAAIEDQRQQPLATPALVSERDELRAAYDRLVVHHDRMRAERDGLLAQQREWLTERDQLVAGCGQLDDARQKLQRCVQEADQLHADIRQFRAQVVAKDTKISQLRNGLLAMDQLVAERDGLVARCSRLAAKRTQLSSRRDQLLAERDSLLARQQQQEKTLRELRTYTDSAGFTLTRAFIVRLRSVPVAYNVTRAIARKIVRRKDVAR